MMCEVSTPLTYAARVNILLRYFMLQIFCAVSLFYFLASLRP